MSHGEEVPDVEVDFDQIRPLAELAVLQDIATISFAAHAQQHGHVQAGGPPQLVQGLRVDGGRHGHQVRIRSALGQLRERLEVRLRALGGHVEEQHAAITAPQLGGHRHLAALTVDPTHAVQLHVA